ncbi:NirD/YgiW/YdeI family stress tolerance protein [Nodularia chucula]|uniref:NirD/YgiW/YdeI family stress tolerance protein n=1 Tax=Nodularia chucula TaxID=3093667 RepID=UPI0039C74E64
MQRKKLNLGLAIATTISITLSPVLVQAQTKIRDLQQSRGITLSGKVISVVGNDFTLSDGTGQIIVDAGPRWWKEINVLPGEELTVVGEFDEGEFDAFTITRANGNVINIRPAAGPPPWSRSRGKR